MEGIKLQCPTCTSIFRSYDSLIEHLNIGCMSMMLQLHCCGKIKIWKLKPFWTMILDHLVICTDYQTEKVFMCKLCNKAIVGYKYPLHIQKHILEFISTKNKKGLECVECGINIPVDTMINKLHDKLHKTEVRLCEELETKLDDEKGTPSTTRRWLSSLEDHKAKKVGKQKGQMCGEVLKHDKQIRSYEPLKNLPSSLYYNVLMETKILRSGLYSSQIMFPCSKCMVSANSYAGIIEHLKLMHNVMPEVSWLTNSVSQCYECLDMLYDHALARLHTETCGVIQARGQPKNIGSKTNKESPSPEANKTRDQAIHPHEDYKIESKFSPCLKTHVSHVLFPCSMCMDFSRTYEEIIKHLKLKHNVVPTRLWLTVSISKCYVCLDMFFDSALARLHTESCEVNKLQVKK